jgi:hypothetical protein
LRRRRLPASSTPQLERAWGRLAGRAIPARRDQPTARLHRQPVPATLTTTRAVQETGRHSGADGSVVTGTPTLPRVPANPRVVTGSCGVFMRYGRIRPLGSCGRRAGAVVLAPGAGSRRGSFLPPPPDDPLPDGQVKGTLRVSLRDRCATPDMPVRFAGPAAIGVREENGGRRCRLRARRMHGFTGTARQSVQAMILHVP